MLKQVIANSTGIIAAMNTDPGEDVGLVVATRPHKLYTPQTMFFSDEVGNIEMAHVAAYGGTPEMVHDGTDNAYWTGTVKEGTWTLDDTGTITDHTPADSGDHCIKGVGTGKDGEIELAHPTSIDLITYEAISGWIYVVGWQAGKHLELQARLNGIKVGDKVNIDDYFTIGIQNSWQQFIVPLTDLNLTGVTIDAFLIKNREDLNQFYLDDIQIEETDTEFKTYQLKPDVGTNLHVMKMVTTYVAPLDMDHADANTPFLSYNNIIGVTLVKGWLLQRIQNKIVTVSQVVQSIHDMVYTGGVVRGIVCDGVNTMLTMEYTYLTPEILKADNLDSLKVLIQDPNMDDFISMRMAVIGYQEI